METKIFNAVSGDYQKSVNAASEILKNGGIVAIPTETVYGLAASAFDDNAIKSVFTAKGRPQDNPLIVHISSLSMLSRVAVDVPETAYILADKFWPGPLTLILPKNEKIAKSVSAGLSTVAVRFPSEKIATDIISKADLPLAAPSANLSGRPSPTTANHVIADLNGKIDGIVIGNDCEVGVESTVVSLVTNPPRLLRPGAVTFEQLLTVIPDLSVDKAVLSEPEKDEKVASPGMKYKHYAPKTETYLVEGDNFAFAEFVNKKKNAVSVCFEEDAELITGKKIIYGKMTDTKTLAKNVFSVLRTVDTLGVDTVFVHAPEKSGVGLAVYNRLIRAAAFRVIKL